MPGIYGSCSVGDVLHHNWCAIIGIDTRQLTKRIREKGTMLGKVSR